MEEILTACVDRETQIAVYTRWTTEEVEQYVMRESGEKEVLWRGPNPYRVVPWVKIELPTILDARVPHAEGRADGQD